MLSIIDCPSELVSLVVLCVLSLVLFVFCRRQRWLDCLGTIEEWKARESQNRFKTLNSHIRQWAVGDVGDDYSLWWYFKVKGKERLNVDDEELAVSSPVDVELVAEQVIVWTKKVEGSQPNLKCRLIWGNASTMAAIHQGISPTKWPMGLDHKNDQMRRNQLLSTKAMLQKLQSDQMKDVIELADKGGKVCIVIKVLPLMCEYVPNTSMVMGIGNCVNNSRLRYAQPAGAGRVERFTFRIKAYLNLPKDYFLTKGITYSKIDPPPEWERCFWGALYARKWRLSTEEMNSINKMKTQSTL